ncbi:MAG TPA: hypothetical protein VK647_08530 [Gemmatimonadales bacterium]|nr:hypothetical protein [Gemmatimonadales bacterium]
MRSRVACVAVVAAALTCNEGLQPNTCPGICGTVTFRGAPPDSTQAVYIVAYHTFPHSRDSLFTFQPPVGALQALPLDGASAFYALPVDAGRYEWVVAVWVKQGFSLANADSTLREAGYYRDPADPTQPGVVNVNAQQPVSIDFTIDFGQMPPPCRYYDPPCP